MFKSKVKNLLISFPRSGTHWLKFMLSDLIGHPPLERRLHDPKILAEVLEKEATQMLVYEHLKFDVAAPVLTSFAKKNLRVILLIRNPLDAFVSAAFYDHWKTGREEKINFDQIIKIKAKEFKSQLANQAVSWKSFPGIYVLKYENLVEKTAVSLHQVMEYLGVARSQKEVKKIIEKYKFETLSGGRKQGEALNSHHFRKGIIGDYKNYLDSGQIDYLKNLWANEIYFLGYTSNYTKK